MLDSETSAIIKVIRHLIVLWIALADNSHSPVEHQSFTEDFNLYEVVVCVRAVVGRNYTNKQEVKCSLLIARHLLFCTLHLL